MKTDFKEMRWSDVEWINVTRDRTKCRYIVNMGLNLSDFVGHEKCLG
jgi:hypothetical protein